MPTAENAKIQIELGRELVDFHALTDSGDHRYFTSDQADVFSGRSGYEPEVVPNGLVTGGAVTPANGNDTVQAGAASYNLAGATESIAADTSISVTRTDSAVNTYRINSILIESAQFTALAGTIGSAFSATRGAAGGPPLIPVDAVEVAQVRLTGTAAATVSADEIYTVPGQHAEWSNYPGFTVGNIGKGLAATVSAEENAHVKFDAVLPASHVGPTAKPVYAKVYEPILSDLGDSKDFKPVENTHSTSTSQYYGKTVGSTSTSLGQGGFTVRLVDGVTDQLVKEKDQVLTVKAFPDRTKAPYMLTQGKLGVTRTFPVGSQIEAACTVSAAEVTADFAS